MVRTQVYLTEEETGKLKALSIRLGRRQSELIRDAIDRYIDKAAPQNRLQKLQSARGLWKGHKQVPDIRSLRQEWERTV